MREINFNKFYKVFNSASVLLVLISLLFLIFKGLNYGIDFKGGTLIELRIDNKNLKISDIRSSINSLNLGDVSVKQFGTETDYLIKFEKKLDKSYTLEQIKKDIKKIISEEVDFRRVENVGPKISSELLMSSLIAISLSLAAMLIYVWIRFEWQFSLGAILALFHDVITTIGLFVFTGLEFNLSTVAAVLTIAGYSVNDTVVVFDRVRENLRKSKSIDQSSIINKSLNDTLSRTITTSVTTLLALLAIYFVGGEVISDFTLAMIWGVMIGTYSSIFVASAFLTFFNLRRTREEEKEDLNYFNNE